MTLAANRFAEEDQRFYAYDRIGQIRELVVGRRSVRRYADRPIERETLEEILEWATWAPSAHNRQPWRFCVITDGQVKRRLAFVMGDRWASDLRYDGVDDGTVEGRVAISRQRMTSAGAIVLVSMCMDDMDVYTDEERKAAEHTMAIQSTALACQNLLLAVHAHGLGACWMCAPLFAPELVRETLDLSASWQPQALITIGYPAEERVSERQPLDSRVVWR